MGGRVHYTIGGHGSRIGLRVLDQAGKMVSATPLSDAQAQHFDSLKSAAMIAAAKSARAKADAEGTAFKLPSYDKWHRLYTPVPEDMLPDRVSLKTGKAVEGFYSDEGIDYVSGRLKAIIEEFDPGQHQFKLLEVVWRDGSRYDAGEIYAFKACQMLNSVDDSHPKFQHYGKEDDPLHALTFAGADLFEVNGKVIGGAGIWYEQRMEQLFFSDAFMARLRAEKVPGWQVDWGKDRSFVEV